MKVDSIKKIFFLVCESKKNKKLKDNPWAKITKLSYFLTKSI